MPVYDTSQFAGRNAISQGLQDYAQASNLIGQFDERRYQHSRRAKEDAWLDKQRQWAETDRARTLANAADDREYEMARRAEQERLWGRQRDVLEPRADEQAQFSMQRAQADAEYQDGQREFETNMRPMKRKMAALELAHQQGQLDNQQYQRQVNQLKLNEQKAQAHDKKTARALRDFDLLLRAGVKDGKQLDKAAAELQELTGIDFGNPGKIVKTLDDAMKKLVAGARPDSPELADAMAIVAQPEMIRSGRADSLRYAATLPHPGNPGRYVTQFEYADDPSKKGFATIAQGTEPDEVATDYGRLDLMEALQSYSTLAKTVQKAYASYAGTKKSDDLDVRYNEATDEFYSSRTGKKIRDGEASKKPDKALLSYFEDDPDASLIANRLGADADVKSVEAVKKVMADKEVDPDTAVQISRDRDIESQFTADAIKQYAGGKFKRSEIETIVRTGFQAGKKPPEVAQDVAARARFWEVKETASKVVEDAKNLIRGSGMSLRQARREVQTAISEGVTDEKELRALLRKKIEEYPAAKAQAQDDRADAAKEFGGRMRAADQNLTDLFGARP